jgi:uncharacterized protein YxeA
MEKNMKKILPLIALIVGVLLGWAIAHNQMNKKWIKFSSTFTPEFQELLTRSYQNGLLTKQLLTEEEVLNLSKLASKNVNDWKSQVFGSALESFKIKKYVENGKVDAAVKSSEVCLERFLELHEKGSYVDDFNEEPADRLAEIIRNADHQK